MGIPKGAFLACDLHHRRLRRRPVSPIKGIYIICLQSDRLAHLHCIAILILHAAYNRIDGEMLRLEADRRNGLAFRHFHGLHLVDASHARRRGCRRHQAHSRLSCLSSLHVHDLQRVGLRTLLLHCRAGEGNLHLSAASPDGGIQQLTVQPQADVVRLYRGDGLAVLGGLLCNCVLYVLARSLRGGCHAVRENSLVRLDRDHHAVIHLDLLAESRVFSGLRHHHIDILLLSHAVHRVPCGLRAILIVSNGVCRQLLAVCQHGLHGISQLVFHTKVQILSVLHSAGAVHDSGGTLRVYGILDLPAIHILKRMKFVQCGSVHLRRSAPANSHQVAVAGLGGVGLLLRHCLRRGCRRGGLGSGCLRNLGLGSGRLRNLGLAGHCGLVRRGGFLSRGGFAGNICGILLIRHIALIYQSLVALLRILAVLHLGRGCLRVVAGGGCHQGCLVAAEGNLHLGLCGHRILLAGGLLCGSLLLGSRHCLIGGDLRLGFFRGNLGLRSRCLRSLGALLRLRYLHRIGNHVDFLVAVSALIAPHSH